MNLAGFNRLSAMEAGARLADCCAARRWVAGMLAERPFADFQRLELAARSIWADMVEDDWLEAFSAHPKIGDLDSLRERFASTRALAGSEQSRMQEADEATLAELARLNVGYKERFGFIFIVFASGKSAGQMLELLRSRIDNTRDEELRNAAAEQLKITLLRLEKLIS